MTMSSLNRSDPNPNPNPNPFPNSIPNSRNLQESDCVARKSFTGSKFSKPSFVSQTRSFNPITPANSPAEYSRRSSFGKDGVHNNEQIDNEQDPKSKPTRPRSPSPSRKGFRNFMSPTISAASKINPSPRKKVLREGKDGVRDNDQKENEQDPSSKLQRSILAASKINPSPMKKVLGVRNEAVRTSASLSSGKFHFYSIESSDDDNVLKSETENYPQTKINLTAQEDYKIESDPDVVVLSPDVSMAPKSTETLPKLLPYDPNRNYLSPRPQFLHYKRVRFEDELVSENSSDPEIKSRETSRSQDSGIEDGKSSSVEPESFQILEPRESQMPEERKIESFQTLEPKESQMPEEGKIESFQILEPRESQLPKESKVDPRGKSGFFTWSKAFVLVLMMSLAFAFAIRSPSIIDTWHQDQIMSKMYAESQKVADIAREHFEGLRHNLELNLVKTFSHLSLMISGIRDVEKFGPLKFKNSTVLQEDGGTDYNVFEQFARATFDDKKGILRYTEESDYEDVPEVKWNMEPEDHVSSPEESRAITEPADFEENELVESSDPSPLTESLVFEDSETPYTQQGLFTGSNNAEADNTQEQDDVIFGAPDEPQDVIEGKNDQSAISSEGTHAEAKLADVIISGVPDEAQDVIEGKNDQSTISTECTHVEAELADVIISGVPDEQQDVIEGKNDPSTISTECTHVEAKLTDVIISGVPDEAQDVIEGKQDQSTISSEGTHVEAKLADVIISGVPDEARDVIEGKQDQSTISSEGAHVEAELADVIISGVPDEPQDVIEGKKDPSTISSEGAYVEAEHSLEHVAVVSGVPDEPPQTVTELESSISAQDTKLNSEVESERFTVHQVLGDNIMTYASLLTALASILVWVKLRKNPTDSNVAVTDHLPVVWKPSVSENAYSESGPIEFDMEGESCPSELSSFQRTSGYNSTRGGSRVTDDAQSHERKKSRRSGYKRESLASSSSEYTMGSPSFGSFTTYSTVPSKHGDEEVVTPVRRSSRIRNQVTYS